MTEEMVNVGRRLFNVAREYRKLFEQENGKAPVVWLNNDETGECVFMADGFNADRIKSILKET